ncbi:MAG: hypothetical protein ACI9TB_001993 [Parasphingorhabdus sp.]|jgi:hypothetical protein
MSEWTEVRPARSVAAEAGLSRLHNSGMMG